MDNKNTDNDNHKNSTLSPNDTAINSDADTPTESPKISDSATIPSDDEFFATNTPTQKPQSRSALVFILTIAFAIILGLLIFSYIYNLAGLRTFTNSYYSTKKLSQSSMVKPSQKQTIDNPVSDTDLNASKQVQDIQQQNNTEQSLDTDTPLSSDNTDTDMPIVSSQDTQPLSENEDNTATPNTDSQQEVTYQQKITYLHREFKTVSNQFLTLNQQLANGEPYLETLIDLKTLLRVQKINIPTLTEYASGGFPTDMIIVTDALKLLKKMAMIESRNNAPDTVSNILNKFIVITPRADNQGLSGTLRQINKALNNGDFDAVSELIDTLSPQEQKRCQDLKNVIADKKAITREIKLLNDAIIDNIFTQPQNNNIDA